VLGALAIIILVPLGLISAFVGVVRQEEPKKYCIIGFILNMLWFLLPVLTIAGDFMF